MDNLTKRGYNMRHETVEYDVLAAFIPAIINGDETGLTDDEVGELDDFMGEAAEFAQRRSGYRSHHWTTDARGAGFGRCEISACFGDRETLQLVIMLD